MLKLQCGHKQTDDRYTIMCEQCWNQLHDEAAVACHGTIRGGRPKILKQTPRMQELQQWRERRLRDDHERVQIDRRIS